MNQREAEVDRVLRAGLRRATRRAGLRCSRACPHRGPGLGAQPPPVREPGLLEILLGWLNPLALGLFAGVTTAVVTVWLLDLHAPCGPACCRG